MAGRNTKGAPPFTGTGSAPDLQPAPLFHGRAIAAPSWVIPGTIEENCRFLASKVHEAGLLFFETAASLAYAPDDVPVSLADLPLSYHVHLPSDLPGMDGRADAGICCRLMDKLADLGASRAVLHLPANDAARYLDRFTRKWSDTGRNPGDLLLENTLEQSLLGMEDAIAGCEVSVCIDTGHALAYGQTDLFSCAPLLERTRMIHLNAPGEREKKSHLPLTSLTPSGHILCENLIRAVPDNAVLMLELFDWKRIEMSLPILERWLTK